MKRRKGRKAAKAREGAKNAPPDRVFRFDQSKEVRAIARERLGTVKPTKPIQSKDLRKKPKHKKPLAAEENSAD